MGRVARICMVLGLGLSAAAGAEVAFVRGEVNGDGKIDIADPIRILSYLFSGARIGCEDAADLNDDGRLDIADPIYELAYLFAQGRTPKPPFPDPGVDTTDDPLGCETVGLDTDGDGLTDAVEREQYGSDAANADTDGDGADDGEEALVMRTSPIQADTDLDGLSDTEEDKNKNGVRDPGETDPHAADTDNDGLDDGAEKSAGTDPRAADTDGDGLADGIEVTLGTNPLAQDSDGDGLGDDEEVLPGGDGCITNPLVADTDGDGVDDGAELVRGTNPLLTDSDGDGLTDGAEVAIHKSDPTVPDTDGDGLSDRDEVARGTDPARSDTDGDGMPDQWEAAYKLDPCRGDAAADVDGDGLSNLAEFQRGTNPRVPDTDVDGLLDGVEVAATHTDPLVRDTDGDGLLDGQEAAAGTNPREADSDGDGIPDGVERRWNEDLDKDGAVSAADEDSDGDGLADAEEDADKDGIVDAGETDPADADSDDDGMPDGFERTHGFDPCNGADGALDADGDGLSNSGEALHGTDPRNGDGDGDTLPDGLEVSLGLDPKDASDAEGDLDGDGLTNARERALGTGLDDADSDDDGLLDGIEVDQAGTDPLDPDTDADALEDGREVLVYLTDPLLQDSDGDGITDGEEAARGMNPTSTDSDGDGIDDAEEVVAGADGYITDPANPDTDGDGLSDLRELTNVPATDPTNADSDDDGMADGAEWAGACDPRDPDTDDDGLPDGEEVALGTDPTNADTDGDGLPDGDDPAPLLADADGDGYVDGREAYRGAVWFEAEDHAAVNIADGAARNGRAGTHATSADIVDATLDVAPGTYRLWARARSGPPVCVAPADGLLAGVVRAIDVSPGGIGLAGDDTGRLIVFEGTTVTDVTSQVPFGLHPWAGISWRTDGTSALLASADGSLFRCDWQAKGVAVTRVAQGLGPLSCVRWAPGGEEAVLANRLGAAYAYRTGTGIDALMIPPPARPLHAIAWNAAGDEAFLVGAARSIVRHQLNTPTAEPVTGVPDSVPPYVEFLGIVCESSGRAVIVGSEGTILARDAAGTFRDFTPRDDPPGHMLPVNAAGTTPDLTVLCGEGGFTALSGNCLTAVPSTDLDLRGAEFFSAASLPGGGLIAGGAGGRVVVIPPPPAVAFTVYDGDTKAIDAEYHVLVGAWGAMYRWYRTPPFTVATNARVVITNPATANTSVLTFVDRCAVVPAADPLAPATDACDPDSDGDGLRDGSEALPNVYWLEVEDWAPAGHVIDGPGFSNAKAVVPAADGSFCTLTVAKELLAQLLPPAGEDAYLYQVFVRARGGPDAAHTDCKVRVQAAQGATTLIDDAIDVAVVPPGSGKAFNFFVWRPTATWFSSDDMRADTDLVLTLQAQGANLATIVADKFVLARLAYQLVVTPEGTFWAPKSILDPMDPDSDLDGWRFAPPPAVPPPDYQPGDGAIAHSAGPLTDKREIDFGMNPFDMDTDCDLSLDGVDINPLSADDDADGLLTWIEDSNHNGAYDRYNPGDPAAHYEYTDWNDPDSDGDGVLDGNEDRNFNGAFDPGQGDTNATGQDIDGDGIPDGWDTDGDDLPDGLELGLAQPQGGAASWPLLFRADADPATRTDPRKADSDGDGIPDGVEDANKNGRCDAGETDPSNADTDGDNLPDGVEDVDHDGVVDSGETSPRLKDTDGDGLSDGEEVLRIGSNPLAADSDGDGVDDYEEVTLGADGYITDPSDPDCDGDGLKDGEEVGVSDPWKTDTDGDGLDDKEEVTRGSDNRITDPRKADTDDDGLSDKEEVTAGIDGALTDPCNPDTDADGFSDGEEAANRTNPNVQDAPPRTVARGGVGYGADDWTNTGGVLSATQGIELKGPGGGSCTVEGAVSLDLVRRRMTGTGKVKIRMPNGAEVTVFDGGFQVDDLADPVLRGAAPSSIALTADVRLAAASLGVTLADGTLCGSGKITLGTGVAAIALRGDFCVNPSVGLLTMARDVILETGAGDITLAETALNINLSRLYASGTCRVPFPDIPGLNLGGELPGASFELDPLHGRVKFDITVGYDIGLGPLRVSYGPRGKFEIDVPRGYFLLEAAFDVSDVGVSILMELDKKGGILFEPEYLIPGFIEDDVLCHVRWGSGVSLPIPDTPLSVGIDGEQALRLSADDFTYAANCSLSLGIKIVSIEMGGATAVILFDGAVPRTIVLGSSSGMLLEDLVSGLGDFGKFGEKTETSLEIDLLDATFKGRGIYTYRGFEIDMRFNGTRDGLTGTGALDPPFGIGPAVEVTGGIDFDDGAIAFGGKASLSLGPVTLADAQFTLTRDAMQVAAEARIPAFGALEVSGSIAVRDDGAIDYTLRGEKTLAPLGCQMANAKFTLTPSMAEIKGDFSLPGGLGQVKDIVGHVTSSTFELSGTAALNLGVFNPAGRVKVTQDGIFFAGDVTVPNGGTVRLEGVIERDGSFSFAGNAKAAMRAFMLDGAFVLQGTRTNATLAMQGSFIFADGIGAGGAAVTVKSDGSATGAGTIAWGDKDFSASFSVSAAGAAGMNAQVSTSVEIPWGPDVTGTSRLGVDSSGNLTCTFTGSATYLGASKSLSLGVSRGGGSIKFDIAGTTFTVKVL